RTRRSGSARRSTPFWPSSPRSDAGRRARSVRSRTPPAATSLSRRLLRDRNPRSECCRGMRVARAGVRSRTIGAGAGEGRRGGGGSGGKGRGGVAGASRLRLLRRCAAAGPPERLNGRQLIVELVADPVDLVALEVELAGDLVDDRRLLGADRTVDRLDGEAAPDEGSPLLGRGDRPELARHDEVLGAALCPCLQLRHLDHEDGLRLVEAALLNGEPL